VGIYLVICGNCKKDVLDEQHLILVARKEWGKTKYGNVIQKFICEKCIEKFSKKDIISDD